MQQLFWQWTVRHSGDVTGPSGLSLLQEGVDAWDACPIQDLRVWNLVLPLNMEESAETAQVEVVELFGVYAVHREKRSSVRASQ